MQLEPVSSDAGLTVNQALDAYLDEHVDHKVVDKDRQKYASDHLRAHLGNKRLAEIDILISRKYLKARGQERAQNSTIRRELNVLISAANHARRWKRIGYDQMPQIELPEVTAGAKVKWFTKPQLTTLFDECNAGRLACFIRIAYYTAGRRNSVERLLKTQIDLIGERIHLARPGERVTKKRRPTVPLYPEIRPAIDWLMDSSGTDFLFGSPKSFYRPFAQLCESLGFEGHPHMLRHSRATHMLHDGESIFKVAKLLGDTVPTVERVYGHSSMDFLQTRSSVEGAQLSV